MIEFIIRNSDRMGEKESKVARQQFDFKKHLPIVFDFLVGAYNCRIKTREEIVKYIMRKVFKFTAETILKHKNSASKAALAAVCERYFKTNKPEPEMLLPFREKSKNKTMNNQFLENLFKSETFIQDYTLFMSKIDIILNEDNEGRIDNFIKHLESLIIKGKIEQIKGFKRIPWPRTWIEKAKIIAHDLLARHTNDLNVDKKITSNSELNEEGDKIIKKVK